MNKENMSMEEDDEPEIIIPEEEAEDPLAIKIPNESSSNPNPLPLIRIKSFASEKNISTENIVTNENPFVKEKNILTENIVNNDNPVTENNQLNNIPKQNHEKKIFKHLQIDRDCFFHRVKFCSNGNILDYFIFCNIYSNYSICINCESDFAEKYRIHESWKTFWSYFGFEGSYLKSANIRSPPSMDSIGVDLTLVNSLYEFKDTLEHHKSFMLLSQLFTKLHSQSIEKFKLPAISYGVKSQNGQNIPFAIRITSNTLEFERLFNFLMNRHDKTVSLNDRNLAKEHLGVLIHFFGKNIDYNKKEEEFFQTSMNRFEIYYNKILTFASAVYRENNCDSEAKHFIVATLKEPIRNLNISQNTSSHINAPTMPLQTVGLSNNSPSSHSLQLPSSLRINNPVINRNLFTIPTPNQPPISVSLACSLPLVSNNYSSLVQNVSQASELEKVPDPLKLSTHHSLDTDQEDVAQTSTNKISEFIEKCPKCSLKMDLRSQRFFIHFGLFHLVALQKSILCDFNGCHQLIENRADTISHLSLHTVGENQKYIKSLENIYDRSPYYAAITKLPNLNCPDCSKVFKNRTELLEHMTITHYYSKIASEVEKGNNNRMCTFKGCIESLEGQHGQVIHLGLKHEVSLLLYSFEKEKIKCPYKNCTSTQFLTIDAFENHMYIHIGRDLKQEINFLQKGYLLDYNVCPSKNCSFQSSDDKKLVDHFGKVHKGYISRLIWNTNGCNDINPLDISNKPFLNLKYSCKWCQFDKKIATFDCKRSLMMHQIFVHFRRKYEQIFFEKYMDTENHCKVCNLTFFSDQFGIHAGLYHNEFKESENTVQLLHTKAKYSCPMCKVEFFINENKAKTEILFMKHLAIYHYKTCLIERFKNSDNCPQKSCPFKSFDVETMFNHLLQHNIYIIDFLSKQLRIRGLDNFFYENLQESSLEKTTPSTSSSVKASQKTSAALSMPTIPSSATTSSRSSKTRLTTNPKPATISTSATTTSSMSSKTRLTTNPKPDSILHSQLMTSNSTTSTNMNETKDQSKKSQIKPNTSRAILNFTKFCREKDIRGNQCSPEYFIVFISREKNWNLISDDIEEFLKFVDERNEIKLGEDLKVQNAINQMKQFQKVKKVLIIKKGWIFCYRCSERFINTSELLFHLKTSKHNQGDLMGCKCCQFFLKYEKTEKFTQRLNLQISLHLLSKAHYYNEYIAKNSLKKQLRPIEISLVNYCELCMKIVQNINEHNKERNHSINSTILQDYTEFCKKLNICPITCSYEYICFYISYKKKRFRNPTQVTEIHKIFNKISQVHDEVDELPLCSNDTLIRKIDEIKFGQYESFQYCCFDCLKFFSTHKDIKEHLNNDSHKSQLKKSKNLNCECLVCDLTINEEYLLDLHKYNHIVNLECKDQIVIKNNSLCFLCDEQNTKAHFNSSLHKKYSELAENYLEQLSENQFIIPKFGTVKEIRAYFKSEFLKRKEKPNDDIQVVEENYKNNKTTFSSTNSSCSSSSDDIFPSRVVHKVDRQRLLSEDSVQEEQMNEKSMKKCKVLISYKERKIADKKLRKFKKRRLVTRFLSSDESEDDAPLKPKIKRRRFEEVFNQSNREANKRKTSQKSYNRSEKMVRLDTLKVKSQPIPEYYCLKCSNESSSSFMLIKNANDLRSHNRHGFRKINNLLKDCSVKLDRIQYKHKKSISY